MTCSKHSQSIFNQAGFWGGKICVHMELCHRSRNLNILSSISIPSLVEVFTFFSEKFDAKCLLFFTTFSTRKVCEKIRTFSLISCFISKFSPGGEKGLEMFCIFHILFWPKM